MLTKFTLLGCAILTLLVVTTALSIEHWNNKSGHFLPRREQSMAREWRVPSLEYILDRIDYQIAEQRAGKYSLEHPDDEPTPADHTFFGAPYSPTEQAFIDRGKDDHKSFTQLHWWVTNLVDGNTGLLRWLFFGQSVTSLPFAKHLTESLQAYAQVSRLSQSF